MKIKRRKKINILSVSIFLLICLLLLATILYYNYNQSVTGKVVSTSKVSILKDTNLKTGPDAQYPTIKMVSSGEQLEKQSEYGDWLEVKTKDGVVGWVPGWNILNSNIKSPEEQMKSQLPKYTVIINPIFVEEVKDYNLEYSKLLGEKLKEFGINVILTRETEIYIEDAQLLQISNSNENSIIININVSDDDKFYSGVSLYYNDASSNILSKYIEKSLNNNYLLKTRSGEKNTQLVSNISDINPEILVVLGNLSSSVDKNVLDDKAIANNFIFSLSAGIENYFYYLLKIDEYNQNRREQLLNAPKKGMNVPFYYTSQDEFRDISYGTDGNRTIKENGDAIIALSMISEYLKSDSSITPSTIVDWAKGNYYVAGQGTSYLIVDAFSKNYDFKILNVNKTQFDTIDEALKNNKPVLIQFSAGLFGDKMSYKVLRGKEDDMYYLNDPNDDDLKLNNYTGFTKKDLEKNMIQAWIFEK